MSVFRVSGPNVFYRSTFHCACRPPLMQPQQAKVAETTYLSVVRVQEAMFIHIGQASFGHSYEVVRESWPGGNWISLP